MDVCVCVYSYSVFVLSCVGSGLATSWSPVQGVLPTPSPGCCQRYDASVAIYLRVDIYCHIFRRDYRRGLDWWIGFIDHLYTPLGLQVIPALLLISTLYKSLHVKFFPSLLCQQQSFPSNGF
jgi:hypothetical protein